MGAGTIDLDEQTIKDAVLNNEIVFIDFWAEWCGPCRAFAPIYERVAAKNQDILFAKVDTDDQRSLAKAFEIRAIPTLMVFRDGIRLFSKPGTMSVGALEDLVRQVRGLDMAEVRARIEAEERKLRS